MIIDKETDSGEKIITTEDEQRLLSSPDTGGRKRAPSASSDPEQCPAPKPAIPRIPVSAGERTAMENLQAKRELGIAMLEMGIAKKDVMKILNITIE